ncbi:protein YgfX [Microbulbifer sp. 2201CG32-9]|uniref:protein YgfX n=1 Tax=Microbulbifer sp. 2201CG32-9 TaxID=3232309 RepID=UPI00345C3403
MTIPACRNNFSAANFERSARLQCPVVPSRLLAAILLGIGLQSLALVWLSQLWWPVSLLASALVIAICWVEWRRIRAGCGVLSTRERRWFWRTETAGEREFAFEGELVLWSWLIVINSRDTKGRRLRLVFARDSLGRDHWRRLQMALRYSR